MYNAYGKILEIKVRYWTDTNDTFINECNEILNLNPIRYKSYYYDTESNMYYLNNRYYNPLICRFITPDEYEYIDINNSLSYNIYAYCNNNPVMYADPDGNWGILIGFIVGALIGAGLALNQDYRDDKSINGSIGGWAYVGSIVGGAVAGCGQGIISTILLGMAGSVINSVVGSGFKPNFGDMVLDCMMAGVLSAVGYGIGQTIRYGFAGLEAKGLKIMAKWKGNKSINHLLKKMNVGVNIGTKDTNKIANALFSSNKDGLGLIVEALASSIPDIIKDEYE